MAYVVGSHHDMSHGQKLLSEDYMRVYMDASVLMIRALLFGVYISAPRF